MSIASILAFSGRAICSSMYLYYHYYYYYYYYYLASFDVLTLVGVTI